MKKITHLFLILLTFLAVSNLTKAQETIVMQDNLLGSTIGIQYGGTLTPEGYQPGRGFNHILFDVPSQVVNGYMEFQVKGFADALMQDPNGGADADNGFFGMYDGRGSTEPIPYFNNFKYNYFRWNFHWRQNRDVVKAVLDCANPEPGNLTSTRAWHACGASDSCSDKREWYTEPNGKFFPFNASTWHTVKVIWNNKTFRITIDGTTVWGPVSGPNDYAPIDFKIWLGAAPGYDDKYGNWVPGTTYRNFKVVSYGTIPNSAPRIISTPITSGIVGQLYQYDVDATGNPSATYSLVTRPTGMTINSINGLIQWTPTSTGAFNVVVKAANGVSPDATQSFTINVTQGQNTAPVITSTPVTNGTVGQLYSYDVNATGNPTPTFSLVTFPSGMNINSTSGVIQWTPTSPGTFNVQVKAANGVSPDATQSFSINVQPSQTTPPVITSTPITTGTIGQLYSYDVNATGNPAPAFSLTTFPTAMTINTTTGLIQWTPASTGLFDVTVKAANGVSPDATQSFTIDVQAPPNTPPVITSTPGTSGTVGQLYSYDVNATGYPAPTFSLTTFPLNMTIDPNTGLIQWTPDTTGSFNVSVQASNGITPDATQSFTINVIEAAQCPPGMITYWKLDETSGTTYADFIGTNNATSTDAPIPSAGRVNGAQQFNGTSDKITAPRIPAYDFASNSSFTFEVWLYRPSGTYTKEEVILERRASSGNLAINLRFNSNKVTFLVRSTTGELFSVTGTTNLFNSKWSHVVGVKDGILNQLRIYVDGELENTVSATYNGSFASTSGGVTIGWRNRTGDESYFKGSIDEVAIYNIALDEFSIQQHYEKGLQNESYCGGQPPTTNCPSTLISYWKLDETSGTTYADSFGPNDATSTDAPTPTAGRVNGAQRFNGTSDRISAPRIADYDFAANSSFTFEAWLNHPTGSYTKEEVVFERRASSGNLAINLRFNSNKITFLARSTTGELFSVTGTKNLYDGIWHHVAGVKDGSLNQLKLYVDGVLDNTVSATFTGSFASTSGGVTIGWRNTTGDESYFKGSIDEAAIYKAALDAATITQHYNNGLQNNGYCQTPLSKIALNSENIFNYIENYVTGNTIQISWESASDLIDGRFEVERSINNENSSKDWQKIGEIDLFNHGESRSFTFTDNSNEIGKFSYRVKFSKGGETIYSKQVEAEILPTEYALFQNYPNPFNPSTKIKFAVPVVTKVTLQVYNQLGEIVAQPVSDVYEAGNYEIDINMSGLASGVYFYKITAGSFSNVKKMMLTK